jgi:hypothetical protein
LTLGYTFEFAGWNALVSPNLEHDTMTAVSATQLAQINIGRIRAPLDSPTMAGFVQHLEEINGLADRSPGFVWRLQTEQGDATAIHVFDDENLLINMSVWTSLDTLKAYVYQSRHVEFLRDKQSWFEKLAEPHLALWWIAAGKYPTAEEGRDRLIHLRNQGPSAHAFTFAKPFPPQPVAGQSIA